MAKPPKVEDIETEPGAEERFERTVRRMLNTPPKPRTAQRKDSVDAVQLWPRALSDEEVSALYEEMYGS